MYEDSQNPDGHGRRSRKSKYPSVAFHQFQPFFICSEKISNHTFIRRFSKIKKTTYRPTFASKEKLRHDLKHIKELSRSVKEEKKQENEQKRQRREENFKRKQENERKSEVVQIIKNPAKLKRMKKKALRKIEKRDLDTIKTV